MKKRIREFLEQIPGGLATRYDLRRPAVVLAGYVFLGLLPKGKADQFLDRFLKGRREKFDARRDRDPIVLLMKQLLKAHCSDAGIEACASRYQAWRAEDLWARWLASLKSDGQVRTDVLGLEHVDAALERGQGVVFWGMTFCGTLFPKIALARAGVELTQLSSADHGTWFPLTLAGKYLAGPLHCHPEDQYIRERVRIPVDGSSKYLFRLGRVLKNNGCIWMAGERTRAKRLITAQVLGRPGGFPVGAPMLALRHKAALLPAHTERLGKLHYRLTIEPPIALDEDASRDETIEQAVQEYARQLDNLIRQRPGDWDWNHLWPRSLVDDTHDD